VTTRVYFSSLWKNSTSSMPNILIVSPTLALIQRRRAAAGTPPGCSRADRRSTR